MNITRRSLIQCILALPFMSKLDLVKDLGSDTETDTEKEMGLQEDIHQNNLYDLLNPSFTRCSSTSFYLNDYGVRYEALNIEEVKDLIK